MEQEMNEMEDPDLQIIAEAEWDSDDDLYKSEAVRWKKKQENTKIDD